MPLLSDLEMHKLWANHLLELGLVSRDAGIWSSDLGITWSTGDGRTLIAFGDNYGPGHFGPFSRFRGSALAWADTRNPYNVRTTKFFTGFENKAEEIVDCGHGKHNELSKIPTAALSINGVQYIAALRISTSPASKATLRMTLRLPSLFTRLTGSASFPTSMPGSRNSARRFRRKFSTSTRLSSSVLPTPRTSYMC